MKGCKRAGKGFLKNKIEVLGQTESLEEERRFKNMSIRAKTLIYTFMFGLLGPNSQTYYHSA